MTILGIGNDIIEIERIRLAIERFGKRFLNRIFTSQEQEYCLSHKEFYRHFAGRFAAKEAIAKALGSGFSLGLEWTDIEILKNEKGKPIACFSPKIEGLMESLKDSQILISISHCHEYATAFAVWSKTK